MVDSELPLFCWRILIASRGDSWMFAWLFRGLPVSRRTKLWLSGLLEIKWGVSYKLHASQVGSRGIGEPGTIRHHGTSRCHCSPVHAFARHWTPGSPWPLPPRAPPSPGRPLLASGGVQPLQTGLFRSVALTCPPRCSAARWLFAF